MSCPSNNGEGLMVIDSVDPIIEEHLTAVLELQERDANEPTECPICRGVINPHAACMMCSDVGWVTVAEALDHHESEIDILER